MVDEANTGTTEAAQTEEANTGATSAGTQNTDQGAGESTTQTVPYERFKQVNEELKAIKAEQAKQAKAAQQAEETRLKEQGKYQELADKEKARADAAEARHNDLLRRYEFGAAVKRQKITFADDKAEADAMRLAGLEDIEVKDGEVDAKAMDTMVAALVKERPYLLKKVDAQNNDAGAGVGSGGKTPEQEAAKQQEIRQRML